MRSHQSLETNVEWNNKDYQISEEDKAAQLRYIIARKDAKIKSLEMENELMRDFLSLTERK